MQDVASHIFTIHPSEDILEQIALFICGDNAFESDPAMLQNHIIIFPNRRLVNLLEKQIFKICFERFGKQAVILPKILSTSDITKDFLLNFALQYGNYDAITEALTFFTDAEIATNEVELQLILTKLILNPPPQSQNFNNIGEGRAGEAGEEGNINDQDGKDGGINSQSLKNICFFAKDILNIAEQLAIAGKTIGDVKNLATCINIEIAKHFENNLALLENVITRFNKYLQENSLTFSAKEAKENIDFFAKLLNNLYHKNKAEKAGNDVDVGNDAGAGNASKHIANKEALGGKNSPKPPFITAISASANLQPLCGLLHSIAFFPSGKVILPYLNKQQHPIEQLYFEIINDSEVSPVALQQDFLSYMGLRMEDVSYLTLPPPCPFTTSKDFADKIPSNYAGSSDNSSDDTDNTNAEGGKDDMMEYKSLGGNNNHHQEESFNDAANDGILKGKIIHRMLEILPSIMPVISHIEENSNDDKQNQEHEKSQSNLSGDTLLERNQLDSNQLNSNLLNRNWSHSDMLKKLTYSIIRKEYKIANTDEIELDVKEILSSMQQIIHKFPEIFASVNIASPQIPDISNDFNHNIKHNTEHYTKHNKLSELSELGGKIMNEVEVKTNSGKIRLDKIIITETEVIIIDFKTDKKPAASLANVKASYKNQMLLYKKELGKIYKTKKITAKILWVQNNNLMQIC